MRSKKKLWGICLEVYQKMYEAADPPLDFKQAMKDGITAKENWFMKYYLPTQKAEEILNKILKKHRCNTLEKRAINKEIWLGSSPSGVKK